MAGKGVCSVFLMVCIMQLAAVSCRPEIKNASEMARWMRNPDHGLVDQITVEGVTITAQYVPVVYLNLLKGEVRSQEKAQPKNKGTRNDHVVFEYDLSFLDLPDTDPMYVGVVTPEELIDRYHELAFELQNEAFLHVGASIVECISAEFQQDVGLRTSRRIRLIFRATEDQLISAPTVELLVMYRFSSNRTNKRNL